jgi:hypothetical protein
VLSVFETALSDDHALLSHATKESWQAVDASYSSAYTDGPGYQEEFLAPSPKRATAIDGHTRTYARDVARRCQPSGAGAYRRLTAAAPQNPDRISRTLAQLVSFAR